MVVFFNLLVPKGPVFLPVWFSPRNRLNAFCFGQPIFPWILSVSSLERSSWRAGCQFSIRYLREQWGGQGLGPPWQSSSILLDFSHFWPRPQNHMPDLMCRTFFMVHKYPVSLPTLPRPTTQSTKHRLLKEASAAEPLLLPKASNLHLQVSEHSLFGSFHSTLTACEITPRCVHSRLQPADFSQISRTTTCKANVLTSVVSL